jgi:hypothetical protein
MIDYVEANTLKELAEEANKAGQALGSPVPVVTKRLGPIYTKVTRWAQMVEVKDA